MLFSQGILLEPFSSSTWGSRILAQLWSINDYITNPHWIYPGNEVVFTLGTLLEPPKIDLETTERRGFQPTEVRIETTDVSCGPDVRFDFPQNTGIFTVPGFISDPEELFTVGKVSRARKNKGFLGRR